MRRVALLGLVAVMGLALGRVWPSGAASDARVASENAPSSVVAPDPLPPCPDAEPVIREIETLSRELGRLEGEMLDRYGYDAERVGLPIPWPDDLGDLWREASVEGALTESLDRDGALVALDCSEYPCMAIVAPLARAESSRIIRSDRRVAFMEALSRRGLTPWSQMGGWGTPNGQLDTFTLAFIAPDHDFPDKRLAFRVRELRRSAEPALTKMRRGHAER